ncbi:unnamed protein product [Macrosiphum euphorbiae]|uniref:Uncharacterized protein n=1 Tax=Macrosiphum euphorbiae TaxID=13131 RepID=A0AAV0XZ83_9HEMI|nr:unnamed protein product [Macrosiphum euphorbiae]
MSDEIMSQCHFSYMDEIIPISLVELGAEMGHDWRGYLNVCTSVSVFGTFTKKMNSFTFTFSPSKRNSFTFTFVFF